MSKKKVKGRLPNKSWLIRNGYRGLVECMRKHPDKFAHIEQEAQIEKKQRKIK